MSSPRAYHSSLREEQANQTRLRIRQAAQELFGAQGFAATTVTEIAKVAGVSPATIYATFESKAGIVAAMLEAMEEEAGIGAGLETMFAEPDPYVQMRLYVSLHCTLFATGGDILRAAIQAVETPEVAELMEKGDGNRRAVIDVLTAQWHQAGALRGDLSPEAAADRLWLLTTVEGFLNAVDRLGWRPEQYEEWLAGLARAEVLKSTPT